MIWYHTLVENRRSEEQSAICNLQWTRRLALAQMQRSIALLRAINVGGHTVKMDQLRTLFVALGYANVTTYIASGNVIFETPPTSTQVLEAQIERHLRDALGYEVLAFIRTAEE